MSASVLKSPPPVNRPETPICSTTSGAFTVKFRNCPRFCFISSRFSGRSYGSAFKFQNRPVYKFSTFAVDGKTAQNRTVPDERSRVIGSEPEPEPEVEGSTNGAAAVDASTESHSPVVEESTSVVISSLNLYKEAFANNDETKLAEVESFLKTIEDEKIDLQKKVVELFGELSCEKDRVLRISVAFDAFRKQVESERLSLVTNAQGDVMESLLSVLDSFAQAETEVKVGSEGEAKIDNSYRNIRKQFMEIMVSFGVVPVEETVEKPFDSNVAFRFNRIIDELFVKLYKVCSSFTKTWIR